ncbi:acyl-CoA dehydrogenase family protein [Paraburkholderia sp. J63]|uniref:acyl-CoA dehydrogenase family protein n=1 Tax=Paraburkholderia sp. J63 TaxID=2805434 RepID=UPI002ABD4CFE|nr:acyl-CoA dehydrogenase family protein [Paraburkholderia sp. J63]
MTFSYHAPLRDMRFVIEEWLDAESFWRTVPAWTDLDTQTAQQVLEEAARFVTEQLAPLNSTGDLQGCRFEQGAVTTPDGFQEAYRAYVEGGWPALAASSTYGGQDLPQLLEVALHEMLAAANHAWLMSPGLTHGASACLQAHGSAALKHDFLEKIVTGEWLTTMCLTEPQAGTDLGLLRTKAVPAVEGAYRITGSKIFITGGEHDLTENIVHMVLARLPDAPSGTRGLSLFLVPKWLPGAPEPKRNSVHCDGIEKKMGLKASPTCTMQFDEAHGWLIGEPNRGLAAMFVMMNAARLQVAMQGVGHAECAWQRAIEYASERVQMRAVVPPPVRQYDPRQPVPIALHPAMRRLLMDVRCVVEGERAIGYWIGQWIDIAARHPESNARQQAERFASLLTPVAKAFFTANGFDSASSALQVFGGYGYIHEYGIEQTVRDSRVSMLYEGTNEIQAIDLLTRKVIDDNGKTLDALFALFRTEAASVKDQVPELRHVAEALERLCGEVSAVTGTIVEKVNEDPELPYRVAGDYLAMFGWLLLAFAWARSLRLATRAVSRDAFHESKCVTGRYFFDYKLVEFEHRKRLAEIGIQRTLPYLNQG